MEENTINQSTEEKKRKLSIQERWGKAAQEGIEAARKMTDTQILAQARRNSGYVVTAIHALPKPGMGRMRKTK